MVACCLEEGRGETCLQRLCQRYPQGIVWPRQLMPGCHRARFHISNETFSAALRLKRRVRNLGLTTAQYAKKVIGT